jgi:hypothetical protein
MFTKQIIYSAATFVFVVVCVAQRSQAQPMRPPETSTSNASAAGSEPGYLGMVADDRQEHGEGIRVKDVDPDSPAAKGGLQAEDLITAINGQAMHSMDDMKNVLGGLPAGTQLKFQVQRQGAAQNVDVTLGQRPPPDQRRFQQFGRIPESAANEDGQAGGGGMPPGGQYPQGSASGAGGMNAPRMGTGSASGAAGRPLLGVRTLPVTPEDQMRLGLNSTAGAHVVARTLGSPAEKAKIPLDAVITAVNGTMVDSPNGLSALLGQSGVGSQVELTYMYNGKPLSVRLTLASTTGSVTSNGAQPTPPGVPQPPMPMADSQRQFGSQPGAVDIGRAGDASSRPVPGPPRPLDAQPQSSDAQRINALERRVQELEQKVQELQQRLQQQESGPARGT